MLRKWLKAQIVPSSGALHELRGLIEEIVADQVVTSAERQQLLQFLRSFSSEARQCEKGAAFEEFVVTRFDSKRYRLIEWRSDKYIRGWGGPLSCQWPDLEMEYVPTGERFAIECKFRSSHRKGKVEWATADQLESYRAYQRLKGFPVFIAIGLGGAADAPQSFYLIRLNRMKYADVTLGYLKQFESPKTASGLEFG